MAPLPGRPISRDQVTLMRQDNVASPGQPGLGDLGITPTARAAVLPTYLGRSGA
jgi:NADH dehydrogenase